MHVQLPKLNHRIKTYEGEGEGEGVWQLDM